MLWGIWGEGFSIWTDLLGDMFFFCFLLLFFDRPRQINKLHRPSLPVHFWPCWVKRNAHKADLVSFWFSQTTWIPSRQYNVYLLIFIFVRKAFVKSRQLKWNNNSCILLTLRKWLVWYKATFTDHLDFDFFHTMQELLNSECRKNYRL